MPFIKSDSQRCEWHLMASGGIASGCLQTGKLCNKLVSLGEQMTATAKVFRQFSNRRAVS